MPKSKISSAIVLLILLCIKSKSQTNLVQNWSFEDTVTCPNQDKQIFFSKNWFQPRKLNNSYVLGSSSDYFNACSDTLLPNNVVGVPYNSFGTQYARTGNAYAGIRLYNPYVNTREYIEVELSSSLRKEKKYCVEIWVNLSDKSKYFTSNIGIYFSKDSAFYEFNASDNMFRVTPQLENTTTNYISDTISWTKIEWTYWAVGGEKFLTIGNFKDSLQSNIQLLQNSTSSIDAYYFIDDIKVAYCDTIKDNFFQMNSNPSNGNVMLDYEFFENVNAELIFYNVLGQKTNSMLLLSGEYVESQVDLSFLNSGLYIWSIVIDGHIFKSDKILIVK